MELLFQFQNTISKPFSLLKIKISNFFKSNKIEKHDFLIAVLDFEKKKNTDLNEYCKELEISIKRMSRRNIELSNINRMIRDIVTRMDPGMEKLQLERILNEIQNPLKKK